ncbi:hypothetical protein WR25_16556 [Diploscapter pachys]|uniref:Uncharacterized protein n=1 Tax=Diploscapter pachys TaxID=2018661 RepID=A0A2A2K8I2_9BILA|nr:hypothetical protein WR25_16556 [Diploscapter pachys]
MAASLGSPTWVGAGLAMRVAPAHRIRGGIDADGQARHLGHQILRHLGGDRLQVQHRLRLGIADCEVVMRETFGEFDVDRLDLAFGRLDRLRLGSGGLGMRRGARLVHLGAPGRFDLVGGKAGLFGRGKVARDLAFTRVHAVGRAISHPAGHSRLVGDEQQDDHRHEGEQAEQLGARETDEQTALLAVRRTRIAQRAFEELGEHVAHAQRGKAHANRGQAGADHLGGFCVHVKTPVSNSWVETKNETQCRLTASFRYTLVSSAKT